MKCMHEFFYLGFCAEIQMRKIACVWESEKCALFLFELFTFALAPVSFTFFLRTPVFFVPFLPVPDAYLRFDYNRHHRFRIMHKILNRKKASNTKLQ